MHEKLKTDLLIAGGGASGVCAAIQAVRMGVKVLLVEETPWLGGMLTSAGVSAIDGNHNLPSGLWGEFRQRLYEHYGGQQAVETGWVSHTLFEPKVGNAIFQQMVDEQPNISVRFGYRPVAVQKTETAVREVDFSNEKGDHLFVEAQVTIDATEYGDLLPLAGCEYRSGRDARTDFGEPHAPKKPDRYIQDMTFVAILKEYDSDRDMSIKAPPDYDPAHFSGMCKELSDSLDDDLVDCRKMLEYGRLPNRKIMLNWPIKGNDTFVDYIDMNWEQRRTAFQAARNATLNCLYHLQTRLGMKHLGLTDDEFATADRLPYLPYIREARRLRGIDTLRVQELIDPYYYGKYSHGIAVGDYPLDHHHDRAPASITESYPNIPAFNVPYECLVPYQVDGLLVAEKSISVTHIVNGCTRLQPVVMQIGQAAGAAAALCVNEHSHPRDVDIRCLQQHLLDSRMWLMPFSDITPGDPAFQAIQRTGLLGLLKGEPVAHDWENRMYFHPQEPLTRQDAVDAFRAAGYGGGEVWPSLPAQLTRSDFIILAWTLRGRPQEFNGSLPFEDVDPSNREIAAVHYAFEQGWVKDIYSCRRLYPGKTITRKEGALLLDRIVDPFNLSGKS
ncbi:FAD-dependent oxidoreductase [candidate division KSB1 bacterium]|nr:FAD-dependent oxidoreductase [candidate division KSB1 bacterium]